MLTIDAVNNSNICSHQHCFSVANTQTGKCGSHFPDYQVMAFSPSVNQMRPITDQWIQIESMEHL
jgi:hypothetical protein